MYGQQWWGCSVGEEIHVLDGNLTIWYLHRFFFTKMMIKKTGEYKKLYEVTSIHRIQFPLLTLRNIPVAVCCGNSEVLLPICSLLLYSKSDLIGLSIVPNITQSISTGLLMPLIWYLRTGKSDA